MNLACEILRLRRVAICDILLIRRSAILAELFYVMETKFPITQKYNSVISHCYIILIHRDLSSIEIEIYSSPITLKQTTKPQINSVIHTMNGIIKSNPNKLPKIPVIPL